MGPAKPAPLLSDVVRSISVDVAYTTFRESTMAVLLELVPAIRPGFAYPGGASKSECHFLDFVISGQSLWEQPRKPDMVSVLCSEYAAKAHDESVRAINRLLLIEKANLPDDRRSLFICSECGDSGCGAITGHIVRDGGAIVWGDFGHQNNYEDHIALGPYEGLGPFMIDAKCYESLFVEALGKLAAP